MVEVEQIFKCIRVLVPGGEMKTGHAVIATEKALFDESQQRRMIAQRMRHIMRLREGRNCQKGHPETELIEAGAKRRIAARGWVEHRT